MFFSKTAWALGTKVVNGKRSGDKVKTYTYSIVKKVPRKRHTGQQLVGNNDLLI
jgi:hypothetical protein